MTGAITVSVPATSANLGPGFDCLGLALALYNQVEVAVASSGLHVEVSGEGVGAIPADGRNLVVRAAERVFAEVGRRPAGLRVVQHNGIPPGGGLGSSAAAILGGLLAANALLDAPFSSEEILALAADMEGHPDNAAAALFGGLTLVAPANGRYLVEKFELPAIQAIVVLPAFELPTKLARAALPKEVPLDDVVYNLGRLGLVIGALSRGDYRLLAEVMDDRLHQPYRLPLIPGMSAAFAAARAASAAVALSGAGPAAIAFAAAGHEAIAAAMSEAFASAGLATRRWLLPVDRMGAQVGRA
jgi:homoserine kinase